jgi:hypothetical protein
MSSASDRSRQDAIKGTGHPAILDDAPTSIYSIDINSRSYHRVAGHAITTESASSRYDRNTLPTAHNEALCVKRFSEVSLWLLAWSSVLCRGRARGRRVVAGRSPQPSRLLVRGRAAAWRVSAGSWAKTLSIPFGVVIMNPPSAELAVRSWQRAAMQRFGIDSPNLRAAFLALGRERAVFRGLPAIPAADRGDRPAAHLRVPLYCLLRYRLHHRTRSRHCRTPSGSLRLLQPIVHGRPAGGRSLRVHE